MTWHIIETLISDDAELKAEIWHAPDAGPDRLAGQYKVRYYVTDPGEYLDPQHYGLDLDYIRERYARPFVTGRAYGAEEVTLKDGKALQGLVPGVAPVPALTRDLKALEARRRARRGDAPPPAGGLFDDTARNQLSLL